MNGIIKTGGVEEIYLFGVEPNLVCAFLAVCVCGGGISTFLISNFVRGLSRGDIKFKYACRGRADTKSTMS